MNRAEYSTCDDHIYQACTADRPCWKCVARLAETITPLPTINAYRLGNGFAVSYDS